MAGETLVCLADGRRVPIRDLVGTAPEVLAVSLAGTIVTAKSERVWRVGTRGTFAVRLASGRMITATAAHRLLSAQGWTAVERLSVGDRLAIARRLPEPVFPEEWADSRVALLGQLIGDGSYLSGQPRRYMTSSEANSKIVSDAARAEFGCEVKRYAGRGCWHQLLISGNGNRWHPHGLGGWLRQLGIFGQRSYEKRIPEAAFQLSDGQIALLLRHLWATDGTIAPRRSSRGSDAVFYSTNSPGLASDVAALLLRLGIVARISSAKKGTYRPSFFVLVSGAADQRRCLETVGAFGPREPQARRLEARLGSQRRMAALRGTAYGGSAHFRFAPSRGVLQTSDLFWDRIVGIESAGEEAVFDLTVPGPGCWLADGVVSHNSGALEQDADVILFLYRQSQYKEDLPPEEANVAEVIIGKQRNGPVGTVRVVFLPQYARFENVADLHRQPQPF